MNEVNPVWIWLSGWMAGAASVVLAIAGLILICFWPRKESRK